MAIFARCTHSVAMSTSAATKMTIAAISIAA
jgi:hypothetical protein